jgi:polyhydroxyalkanoate synthesis repressor PhaR
VSDILALIRSNVSFQVVDAKTSDDITRSVLVQIITEQESGDTPLFNNKVLAQFIRMYDDTTRDVFIEFMEKNFQFFTDQQRVVRDNMGGIVSPNPVDVLSNLTKKNMEFWQSMQENFMKNSSFPYPPSKDD